MILIILKWCISINASFDLFVLKIASAFFFSTEIALGLFLCWFALRVSKNGIATVVRRIFCCIQCVITYWVKEFNKLRRLTAFLSKHQRDFCLLCNWLTYFFCASLRLFPMFLLESDNKIDAQPIKLMTELLCYWVWRILLTNGNNKIGHFKASDAHCRSRVSKSDAPIATVRHEWFISCCC